MTKSKQGLKTAINLSTWAQWLLVSIILLIPPHTLLTVWAAANFGHLYLFSAWKEMLLFVCFGLLAAALATSPTVRRAVVRWPVFWLIAATCFLYLIYVVLALDKKQAVIGSVIDLRFLVIFLLAQLTLVLGAKQLGKRFVHILLAIAAVLSLFAILQATILPPNLLEHVGYERIGQHVSAIPPSLTPLSGNSSVVRAQATLRGPNATGAYLLIPLSISFVYLLTKRRLIYAALTILYPMALAVTYSRSAWIGVAIVGATIGLVHWRWPLYRLVIGLVLVSLFLGVSGVVLSRNQSLQDVLVRRTANSNSNAGHAIATKGAIKEIVHELLGRGPGTAGPASALDSQQPRIAENYFLQVAQEVGWLGLGLLLAIHALVLLQLWRQRSSPIILGLLASFLGLLLTNLFLHTWADETVALTWWGLAGLMLSPTFLKPSPSKSTTTTML